MKTVFLRIINEEKGNSKQNTTVKINESHRQCDVSWTASRQHPQLMPGVLLVSLSKEQNTCTKCSLRYKNKEDNMGLMFHHKDDLVCHFVYFVSDHECFVWCPWWSEEGVESLRTGITDGC